MTTTFYLINSANPEEELNKLSVYFLDLTFN